MSNVRELDLKLRQIDAEDVNGLLRKLAEALLEPGLTLLDGFYFGSFSPDVLFSKNAYIAHSIRIKTVGEADKIKGVNLVHRTCSINVSVMSPLHNMRSGKSIDMMLTTYLSGAFSGSYSLYEYGNQLQEYRLCLKDDAFKWELLAESKKVIHNQVDTGAIPTVQSSLSRAIKSYFTREMDKPSDDLTIPFKQKLDEILGVTFESNFDRPTAIQIECFKILGANHRLMVNITSMKDALNKVNDDDYLNAALRHVQDIVTHITATEVD